MNSLKKYHTPKVARIVGELISDDHMQTDYRYLISFYSMDFETIKWFEKRMKNIFNVKSWIFQDKRSVRYKLFIKSKKILFLLNDLGVPIGNKTNQFFYVSKWIILGELLREIFYLLYLIQKDTFTQRYFQVKSLDGE